MVPPLCRGANPPLLLIPTGKANRAVKPPCPAPLSRELSLLAPGEMSWRRLSAAAGWPGGSREGCARLCGLCQQLGTAPAPKRQDNTGFVQISPRKQGGREGGREGGRFNLPFPCQSSPAFCPSGESFSITERADQSVLSAAALGQGWGGGNDPEVGLGGVWLRTGWIHGWAAAASTAAHRHFAGQGAQPRQAMSLSVWLRLDFTAQP